MSGIRDRMVRDMRQDSPGTTLIPLMRKLERDAEEMRLRSPADAKARATAARIDAIGRLDELHATLQKRLAERGVGYHRAATAAEANAVVLRLLGGAKRVPKSKSMVGEEIGLTPALRQAGIDVLETDIGEYIVDIEGRGPSHLTGPALHLNRARIRALLERGGTAFPDDDPGRLSRYVRDIVGAFFQNCDAGITGANAVSAGSGRLVIVENEGNVSLGASHPKLHIAVTGIEKVVADDAGALAILEMLAPSATAQPFTAFTHFVAEPLPGQERHVVFVDNGRSAIAADPRYRDLLRCIRCGACMNACPVYRVAGGLSYGSPYMGPIGAVLSPLLWRDGRYADLPQASSLCGRCTEVCPVGIPLHRMLLDLREDAVRSHDTGSRKERAAWLAWALTFSRALPARAATAATRIALRGLSRMPTVPGLGDDPRAMPAPTPEARDPELLLAREDRRTPPAPTLTEPDEHPAGLVALFTQRAAAVGATVTRAVEPTDGDRLLEASAGIASTGGIVLAGDQAALRPLLAARRLVVRLAEDAIVRYPSDAQHALGDGNAVILTGGSRTADIEKQIVRGIHGAEELVILLR